MLLIEEPEFPLAHDLKLVALQGACDLRLEVTADGGRYVVDGADRAREACLSLVERARAVNAHLALIPEMVIPQHAVANLIETIGSSPQPLVVLGESRGFCQRTIALLLLSTAALRTFRTMRLALTSTQCSSR